MYFAIISNDNYPEETYTTDIYYRRPTLSQLYDRLGDPEENYGRYYKWCLQVKKIINFQSIIYISGLEYSEDGYHDDDYVVGGDGYLQEEHKQRLTHKQQEKELCGN